MPTVSRPMLRWYTFELLGVVHFLIRIYLLMHFLLFDKIFMGIILINEFSFHLENVEF